MDKALEKIISEPRYHTGTFYVHLESFVQRAERWIAEIDFCGADRFFGNQELKERLLQRIVAEARSPYITQRAKGMAREGEAYQQAVIRTKSGISFNVDTGVAKFSFANKLRSCAIALAHFFDLSSYILKGIFCSRRTQRKVNLFFGLTSGEVVREGNDKLFCDFLFNGALQELFSSQMTIVKMKTSLVSEHSDQMAYCENPIGYALQHANIRLWDRLCLLLVTLRALLYSMTLIIRQGAFSLLVKDILSFDLVRFLDRKNILSSYIMTVSHYTDQPLYLRHAQHRDFKVHMIYYSQNSIPRVFKFDNLYSHLPEWRHIKADCHWVWTDYYKQYLRTVGISTDIKVVGPILFYLPPLNIPKQDDQQITIAVLDVTPVSPDKAIDLGITVYDYYRFENMQKFLLDILEFAKENSEIGGKPIKVLLKHKRLPKGGHHDQRYLDFIKTLIVDSRYFQAAEESMNIYSLIGSTQLSVVYPFTSTYIVSDHLKRNAVIYDPTGMLIPTYDPLPHVRFASGKEELRAALEAMLKGNVHVDSMRP